MRRIDGERAGCEQQDKDHDPPLARIVVEATAGPHITYTKGAVRRDCLLSKAMHCENCPRVCHP